MLTVKTIGEHIGAAFTGDGKEEIIRINKIENAVEGEISFLYDLKFEKYLYDSNATAVVVFEDLVVKKPVSPVLLRVSDVPKSLAKFLQLFDSVGVFDKGISAMSFIHDDAEIGQAVTIGTFTHISGGACVGEKTKIASQVFIGRNVEIGRNVKIFPGVKIYHDCIIGDACTIHSNTVIGSDGFGYNRDEEGNYKKIPQIGNVIIENNVEIGANTVIDRSTFGSTIIREGVKLDNLIQVAHNVEIGANTVIAAQTGIAGSTKLGESCVVGGQVAFVPHIDIANGSQFQGKSGVGSSIKKPNQKFYGYPAIGFKDYIRSYSVFKILPELEKKIKYLEKELKKIKTQ